MPARLQKTDYVLKEKIDESPAVLRLVFAPVSGKLAEFSPGMFIMVGGAMEGQPGKTYTPRAFSIASDPEADNVEIIVLKNPARGGATHESHFVVSKAGDRFVLEGPLASGQVGRKFTMDLDPSRKMALFAGGTGLAPFVSLLRKEDRMKTGTDISVLYSVKRPEEVLLRREMDGVQQRNRVKIDITVTKPESSTMPWSGRTGRMSAEMIRESIPDIVGRDCYICGKRDFSKDIEAMLISLGVPESRIRIDAWG